MTMLQYCVFLLLIVGSQALIFNLQPNTQKCMRDEIHKDVMVTGEYSISDHVEGSVHLFVKDSKGQTLQNKEKASKGKFALTVEEFEVVDVCFKYLTPSPQSVDVTLEMKHGVEAKSYVDLAQAEKLKPLEVELQRLEDLAASIVSDFRTMNLNEADMRSTNESTHSRVLYFSLFSMCCLFGLALFQIIYLRRFFKSKKLI